MPAVTLQNRTTQSNQNCGVLMALSAETLAVGDQRLARDLDGSKPSGAQPSGGHADVETPNIITTK